MEYGMVVRRLGLRRNVGTRQQALPYELKHLLQGGGACSSRSRPKSLRTPRNEITDHIRM
eukprot:3965419-Amphidinium_carterae.1